MTCPRKEKTALPGRPDSILGFPAHMNAASLVLRIGQEYREGLRPGLPGTRHVANVANTVWRPYDDVEAQLRRFKCLNGRLTVWER